MRAPPPREQNSGVDERPPSRRPAETPPPGGGALVEHVVERLAKTERELRAAREQAVDADRHRALLGRAARHVADHTDAPLADMARMGLPALGSWCLVDELTAGEATRTVVATDPDAERAASGLAGPVETAGDASIGLARALRRTRTERLPSLPSLADDQTAEPIGTRRALAQLARGPLMVVPVCVRGRAMAAFTFGRGADAEAYEDSDQRLAEDLAALAALALERRDASERAEAATRAKAQFLTMMSHELRTPLNAIAGYAQLLEMGFRGPLNDGQREAVGRILRGQEHLLELVDAVLTFSRLTGGRLQLESGHVRSRDLVEAACAAMAAEFAAQGIDFRVEPCREESTVIGDRARALEILRHLLSNAAKFTQRGGTVALGCEPRAGVVRFTVTDSGRGVPESQFEAIFQPFVQVEKGFTRSVDGSGMGLAVGRELAQRMGGSLSVSSELGRGSRFVLALPRVRGGDERDSIDSFPAAG